MADWLNGGFRVFRAKMRFFGENLRISRKNTNQKNTHRKKTFKNTIWFLNVKKQSAIYVVRQLADPPFSAPRLYNIMLANIGLSFQNFTEEPLLAGEISSFRLHIWNVDPVIEIHNKNFCIDSTPVGSARISNIHAQLAGAHDRLLNRKNTVVVRKRRISIMIHYRIQSTNLRNLKACHSCSWLDDWYFSCEKLQFFFVRYRNFNCEPPLSIPQLYKP